MVRALGFASVHEVGFGADLVAERYRKLMADHPRRCFIATTCPALVAFVEYFHPALVDRLAPVVSPMLAEAKALRRIYGPDRDLVFISPCIAKKAEADPDQPDEISGVLTFIELQEMLDEAGIRPETIPESDFDEPRAFLGALFPISRGILQAAGIKEDLMAGEVVAADGRANFVEAVKELESGALDARMLEVLCCSGCIMGPGIHNELPLFRRRSLVSRYVKARFGEGDNENARKWVEKFADLDLSRRFFRRENFMDLPSEDEVVAILHRMGKILPTDKLNCGACGYETCRDHAEAIMMGLAESEMCLPYTIEQLRETLAELDRSRRELAGVQAALIQSEKLASMGRLSAAIAHEINNPLGVVLMYTHMLHDECLPDSEMREDLKTIAEQTDRCKKIVAGLLNFARQNKVMHQPVDINDLVRRCLKTMSTPEGIRVSFQPGINDPVAEIDADQMTQVLVNLISNAVKYNRDNGRVDVYVSAEDDGIAVRVSDTGIGISEEDAARLFREFARIRNADTDTVSGSGLGLSIVKKIAALYNGDVSLESTPGRGSTFTVILKTASSTASAAS